MLALSLNPGLFVEAANECSDRGAEADVMGDRIGLECFKYTAESARSLAVMYFDMLVRDGLVCC